MGAKLKILVADDSPTAALFLRKGLEANGHKVVVARDGMQAVEAAYRENPDLIVSDIIMPHLKGYQVCRLLKDDQSMAGLPIILLTSLDEKADMFWGLRSGADRYFKKGDIATLVGDIEKFIEDRKITPRAGRKDEAGEAGSSGRDIIGRVIQLLDSNLFESTVLNDIVRLVDHLEDYRKIVFGSLNILSEVNDFDLGVALLIGEEAREYYMFVNADITESFMVDARVFMDRYLVKDCKLGGLPEQVKLEIFDPGNRKPRAGSKGGPEISSHFMTSLVTKDVTSGAIGLFSRKEDAFGDRFQRTYGIISRPLNIVVDYARLNEKNKQLSITDGLTKLYNHRYFQETLRREFARAARGHAKLALIMLDIDHFKQCNDAHGHQQGDMVLSELARILKHTLRSMDTVARYGGEEFAILMPDAALADASRVADRLRRTIEETEFYGGGAPIRLTVSIGVSAIPHELICNPAQMISAADQALYRAKKNGRNRVEEAL